MIKCIQYSGEMEEIRRGLADENQLQKIVDKACVTGDEQTEIPRRIADCNGDNDETEQGTGSFYVSYPSDL